MFKKEGGRVRADFLRDIFPSIDVSLDGEKRPISLYCGDIENSSEKLSEIEMEAVKNILISKKRDMLKQRNFPQVYDEMLSEFLNVQRNRYGTQDEKDKKRRLSFSISGGKLEEVLGEHFNIKNVHIWSIDVGSTRSSAERIDLESDDSYLVLSFRENTDGGHPIRKDRLKSWG